MKKPMLILALCSPLLFAQCGGETETEGDTTDGNATTDETTEVEATPMYPEGTLDPATVDAGTVVTADQLATSYFAWSGREVTLSGYGFTYYGDVVVSGTLDLVTEPEGRDGMCEVTLTDTTTQNIANDQLITVKGTLVYGSWGMELENAEIVSVGDEPQMGIETSAWAYDGSAIFITEFAAMYNAWEEKEVTVSGYYNGTTTSTTDYGVSWRIDLDGSSGKAVACDMASEPPTTLGDSREDTQVKGIIRGSWFGDAVMMEECVLVNR